ncbi:tripartite tricarboxylate transporter TctB family protein [Evansella sp. LMS18]|jgi:CBS domain containing-hemolysin-like protein|uniref:tripartite tricarboxylate transporter TctB family protein n=1 Tax=Evansella sp. LMS18 TaxID=2924033 RepID=UPI0020D02319|nr:tripartite tricarboxylate transporter TctB family protein [Evansella sp. LMS18]UTR12052.1 tripartite tricarboxylate transporter TctB family protein [Evansella sp. LMS18]
MLKETGNLLLLVVILGLGTAYYFDVLTLPNREEQLIVKILFYLLIILVLFEFSKSLFKFAAGRKKQDRSKKQLQDLRTLLTNKPMILSLMMIGYLVLIPLIGFFVSSFVFLLFLNFHLGNRKVKELFVIPGAVLIFTYFLFVQLLNIRLPAGILV